MSVWSGSPSSLRNLIAYRVCNFVMRHVADESYEKSIEAYIDYGIRSHVRDRIEDRVGPPTLRELGIPSFGRFSEEELT